MTLHLRIGWLEQKKLTKFCDTTKVSLREIPKPLAKKIIKKYHYTHSFSSCRYAIGIFYQVGDNHKFFDDVEEKLVGCLTYGYPVGRSVVSSIFSDENILTTKNILELTRLFIHDGYGKNIESYSISQSFKWIKKQDDKIKVLVSYADPTVNHNGSIYQATNWLYQGEGLNLMPNYSVSLTKDPYEWIHSRTVFSKFGSHNIEKLKKAIGHTFWRMRELEKHRYVYFLGNKKENKLFISNLKHPKLPFPKVKSNSLEIQEYQVEEKNIYE
jgi:hypothetical protein